MSARYAYSCRRCHEWAFVDGEILMGPNGYPVALPCPYCRAAASLQPRGRVERSQIVAAEYRDSVCDYACTGAKGTNCVCRCHGENHGSHLTMMVRKVDATTYETALEHAERATARAPKIAAELAEYDAAAARARDILERDYPELAAKARGEYVRSWSRYLDGDRIRQMIRKSAAMRSHAGRMRVIREAIAELERVPA